MIVSQNDSYHQYMKRALVLIEPWIKSFSEPFDRLDLSICFKIFQLKKITITIQTNFKRKKIEMLDIAQKIFPLINKIDVTQAKKLEISIEAQAYRLNQFIGNFSENFVAL